MMKLGSDGFLRRAVDIWAREGRGVTYLDYPELSKRWVRQVFSRLRRLGYLERIPGTYPAQYRPTEQAMRLLGGEPRPQAREGWSAIESVLEKLGEEPFTIHDIHCLFESRALYEALEQNSSSFTAAGWRYDKHNRRWESPKFKWNGRRRWAFVMAFPTGTCQVIIRCDDDPIRLDFEELERLRNFLDDFRAWLILQAQQLGRLIQLEALTLIPSVPDWRVKQWHFGRDAIGVQEVTTMPCINLTVREWGDGYLRLYIKSMANGVVRLERVERPAEADKTLIQWVGERASLAEALKQASRLSRSASEIEHYLHEFAVNLKTHVEVQKETLKLQREVAKTLAEMREANRRMLELLDRLERILVGGGLGNAGG